MSAPQPGGVLIIVASPPNFLIREVARLVTQCLSDRLTNVVAAIAWADHERFPKP